MKKLGKMILFILCMVICFNLFACSNGTKTVVERPNEPTEKPVIDDSMAFDESARIEDLRTANISEFTFNNTVGTDDFGRQVLPVDGKKQDKNRQVGLFYFVHQGGHNGSGQDGIYDVNKITKGGTDLDAFFNERTEDSKTSPVNQNHFVAEPLFGYYRADDPWVIRKQLEMLYYAGIDFITLDTSNAVYYPAAVKQLLSIATEFTAKGYKIPKISFYVNAEDLAGIKDLYVAYYSKSEYSNIWYYVNSKPMVTKLFDSDWDVSKGYWDASDPLKETLRNHFYFMERQWPNEGGMVSDGAALKHDNALPWMEFVNPQPVYKNGFMSVSVAQHFTVQFSDTVGTHGRGWDPTKEGTDKNDHENWRKGPNFQDQWQTVFNNDDKVSSVFLTGWNEWAAQKLQFGAGSKPLMVDNFNAEFSRDIEPMKASANGSGDNFYMQTIQNVKKWAYEPAKHYKYENKTIDIRDFTSNQWEGVKTIYQDFTGDTVRRSWDNFAKNGVYEDSSNRNDIDTVAVSKDENYLYFKITAKDFITVPEDGDLSWMNIYIKTLNGGDKNLHGYQYAINRRILPNGKTTVQKSKGGDSFTKTGEGRYELNGKVLQVKVPLYTLGLGGKNYDIEFKVTDHIKNPNNLDNFYITGDSAPLGRLSYKYGY